MWIKASDNSTEVFFRTTASKLISVKQIDPEKNKEERQKESLNTKLIFYSWR